MDWIHYFSLIDYPNIPTHLPYYSITRFLIFFILFYYLLIGIQPKKENTNNSIKYLCIFWHSLIAGVSFNIFIGFTSFLLLICFLYYRNKINWSLVFKVVSIFSILLNIVLLTHYVFKTL